MINPDTQQVFQLADYFHQLGNAIGEYIQKNKEMLQPDDRNNLFDRQIEILRFAGKINMIGVALVFDDVQDALREMNNLTEEVKKTVKKVLLVQDAIDMVTALVGIGTAIIAKDPKSFAKSLGKAGGVLRAIKDKKI